MNRLRRFALFAVVATALSHPAAGQESTDAVALKKNPSALPWKDLFDGKTLNGLEGDENEKYFRVQDGCIVAGTLNEKIPHNYFLCTRARFANFELTFEAKLVGEGDNAGVQFRSERVPDSTEVSGYQADIGDAWGRPIWGALYDESRRNRILSEPDAEMEKRLVKLGDWNQMRVLCEGNHIQIFLNGERTVDYTETDPDIAGRGIIGLQIHAGPPCEAWYRRLRIRELP